MTLCVATVSRSERGVGAFAVICIAGTRSVSPYWTNPPPQVGGWLWLRTSRGTPPQPTWSRWREITTTTSPPSPPPLKTQQAHLQVGGGGGVRSGDGEWSGEEGVKTVGVFSWA